MAKIINLGGEPVNEGEAIAVHSFETELPENYLLYPNIELTPPRGPALEYDLIILAPHAVYIVEIKDWHGTIVGNDVTWMCGRSERKNPVKSVNHKARVLKSLLSQNGGAAYQSVYVEPLVAIVDRHTKITLSGDCSASTFQLHKAIEYVQQPGRLSISPTPTANALAPFMSGIRKALGGEEVRGRSGKPLTVNHYQVVELKAHHFSHY